MSNTPRVSVILPIYNSVTYLSEAVDSIIAQTYTNWEMLAINEWGSNDGSAEMIKKYAEKDSRIRLIQNSERLGLTESLNLGIKISSAEYIARLDADDISAVERFSKQVVYLDNNPDVGLVGCHQHHFGTEDWIHTPPAEPKLCRAFLLFFCHLCHSTIMFRKSVFIKNKLFFDSHFLAEDFELWSRAVAVTNFANIPEVLGEYRHSTQNITPLKMKQLREESGHIVAASLKRNLNLEIPEDEHYLLNGWDSVFEEAAITGKRKNMLKQYERILRKIWDANKKIGFYDAEALLGVMNTRWIWAKTGLYLQEAAPTASINEIFIEKRKGVFMERVTAFLNNNPTFKGRVKKVMIKIQLVISRPIFK